MTREEALNIIRNVFFHENNQLNNDGQIGAKDIHNALTIACAALCEPSLPSDLDEAARKLYPYERGYDVDLPYPSTWDMNEDARNAFKAGAEWMAEKFVKVDSEGWSRTSDGKLQYWGITLTKSTELEDFYILQDLYIKTK